MLVCINGYTFRHILVFLPSFSVLRLRTCFMIDMFSQMACICHFVFFMSCPEPPMGISGVAWRFPNYYFQLLRCRNLALGFFLLFLRGRHVLHLGGVCMPPYVHAPPVCSDAPNAPTYSKTSYVPIVPCASVCSRGYLHVIGDMGGCLLFGHPNVFGCFPCVHHPHTFVCFPVCLCVLWVICMCYGGTPHMLGVWGHQHICQVSGVCQYIHWMSIMLHLVPFLQFIMSQVSTTMATTTTLPVTVVSSGMSSLSSVTMAPSLMGLCTTLGQHDVVLPPPLTPRCSGGVLGHASVPQQQPPSSVPLQAYANYAMGSPQVGFFFRVEPPTVLYIIYLVSVLVSAFYFQVPCWMPYPPLGAQPLWFAPLQLLGVYLCQAYVQPGDSHWPRPGMHRVAAPSTSLSRGNIILLSLLFPSHPIYMVGHTALGAWQRVTQSLCLLYMMGRGHLFQVWFHLMTQSTLSLWWALNLVILMWWLGIRLMSLLAPGLQSGLWLISTFILGSLVRCHH